MPAVRARLALSISLLAGTLLGAGCYRPSFEDCALTCSTSQICPDDLHCIAGLCRLSETPGACPAPRPDADVSTPDAPPGTPDADVADAPPGTPDARPVDAAMPPDASTMCTTCDPVAQSCCETGLACDLSAAGEAFCRGASVTGSTQGIPCTIGSECARGYTCVAPDGTAVTGDTTCHEFCTVDSMCGGQGGFCDVKVAGTGIEACTTTCDPATSTGCQTGFSCTPARAADGSRWHTDCRRVTQSGSQGTACTIDEQCRKGLICAASVQKCEKLCNVNAPGNSACGGGTSCVALDPTAVFNGIPWGACLPN
jgi:hypothetical protein